MDARRVYTTENANGIADKRFRELAGRLPANGVSPSVCDTGHGAAQLTQDLAARR